jgi:hypothetical protein
MPGGTRGLLLKSKAPCTWAWADSCGFIRERQRRLRVIMHGGNNLSHRLRGKSLLVEQSPAMTSFLNVQMAHSEAFLRCIWGGDT